jgi:hypothetical protein
MLWSRYQCIDELRKEHRERMDEKLGRLSQQMEKELSEMGARLGDGIQDLGAAQQTLEANIGSCRVECIEQITAHSDALQKQMQELGSQVDEHLSSARSGLDAITRESQALVVEMSVDKGITQAAVSRLDAKLGDMAHKVVDQHHEMRDSFGAQFAKLSAQVAGKVDEQGQAIELFKQTHGRRSRELAVTVEEHNTKQDEQIRAVTVSAAELRTSSQASFHTLNERVSDNHAELVASLTAQQEKHEFRVAAIERQASIRSEVVDKRMDDDRREVLDLNNTLHEQLTARVSDLSASIRESAGQLSDNIATLDDKVADGFAKVGTTLSTQHAQHEAQLEALERDVKTERQLLQKTAASVEQLDGLLLEHKRESQEAANRVQQQASSRNDAVESRFRQLQDTVQDNAVDLRRSVKAAETTASTAVQKVATKLDALEQRHDEAHTVIVDKLATQEQQLDKGQQKSKDQLKAVDQKFTEQCRANELRISNNHTQSNDGLAALQTKIVEMEASQASGVSALQERIVDVAQRQEERFEEKLDLHSRSGRELRQSVEAYQTNVGTQLSGLEKRVLSRDASNETAFSELRHQIQEQHQQCTGDIRELRAAQRETHAKCFAKTDEFVQERRRAHDDLEKRVAQHDERHSELCVEVQRTLDQKITGLMQQTGSLDDRLKDHVSSYEARIEEVCRTERDHHDELAAQAASTAKSLAAIAEEHTHKIEQLSATAQREIEKLGEDCRENTADLKRLEGLLTTKIEFEAQSRSTAVKQQEESLRQMSAEHERQTSRVNEQLSTRLSTAEQSALQQRHESESKVHELQTSLEKQAALAQTQVQSVAAQLGSNIDALTARIAQLQSDSRAAVIELEHKLSEKDAAQDTLITDLTNTVSEHHRLNHEATQRLKTELSDQNSAQDSAAEIQRRQLSDQIQNAEAQLTEKVRASDVALVSLRDSTVEQHQALEERLRKATDTLNARLEQHESTTATNHTLLKESVAAVVQQGCEQDSLRARQLETLQDHVNGGLASLTDHCKAADERTASTTSDLAQKVDENVQQLSGRIDHLDQKLVTKLAAQEEEVRECSRTSQQSQRQVNEQVQKFVVETRQNLADESQRVQQQARELQDAIDTAGIKSTEQHQSMLRDIEQLQATTTRDVAGLTRAVESQDTRLTGLLEQQDGRLSKNHEHFTQALGQINVVMQARLQEVETKTAGRCRAVNERVDAKLQECDDRVNDFRSESGVVHGQLRTHCHELERQLTDSAVEQKISAERERAQLDNQLRDAEKRASERESRDASRHADLSTTVDVLARECREQSAQLGAQARADKSELRMALDSTETRLGDMCAELSRDMATLRPHVEGKLTMAASALELAEQKAQKAVARLEAGTERRCSALEAAAADRAEAER